MAMQRVVHEIDPEFNISTSYHSDFFLLRTRVLVNGESAKIRSKEGSYEDPVMSVCSGGSEISIKLWSIENTISFILHKCGIYHVDMFYYEQSPLFHVVFSSESCVTKFLQEIQRVKNVMQVELQSVFSRSVKASHVLQTASQSFTVKVQPELFLVSPNRQERKGAELYLVTTENCSLFVTRWKNSKLFDFGSLYQEEGLSSSTTITTSVPTPTKQSSISTQESPLVGFGKLTYATPPQITSQPTTLEKITTGKPVTFLIQAIGTEPMNYQWQCWKPEGEEDESEDWQDITCDGVKFQAVKAGLKLNKVQACDAGYYRCVVSNSAGSETSWCANLVVVAELADLVNELKGVMYWIPLGLNLGLEVSTLLGIEMERITIEERRTHMLIAWQKQATPTWSAVIQALAKMGMRPLASQLAQNHGILVPKPPKDEVLEQLQNLPQQEEPTRSKLLAEVRNLLDYVNKMDDQLKDANQRLSDSEKSKQSVDNSINKLLNSFTEVRQRIQSIADQRNSIRKELEFKQRECQWLTEMYDKSEEKDRLDSAYKKLLEEQKKIKKLKEELQKKEPELQAAQQEARTQQVELSQLQAQLKKKHDDVKDLQIENKMLTSSCNSAREQVSELVQLIVTLSSDKRKMEQELADTKEESELKSQQIEACNASIGHLTKEVKALSRSLKKKEAAVAQLERKLQSHQQEAHDPKGLLEVLNLTPQIVELERWLKEAEHKKQQAELEKEMAIKEMETQKKFQMQLHSQLGKWLKGSTPEAPAAPTNGATMSRSSTPKLVEKKKKKESPSSEEKSEEQEEQVQVLELQECHDEREEDMRHIESLETEIEKLRRQVDHSQPSSMETTGYLRGVDVIAETSVLITNQAQTFNWAGYGLKLNVPKGALPAGLEECRLLIKVGLSGQFALPENTSLVSAVYWLDSEPRQEFSKHFTLEIQHCVKPTDTSKLSFVRAKCSQTDLPYKFKNVKGGVFSSSSAYGCVQCNHFSLFGAVSDMYDKLYNRLVPQVQLYYASIYYLRKGVNSNRIRIYFVITKNLETHVTFVQRKYNTEGAILEAEMGIEFESDSISLQGVILEDGWEKISVFYPTITKEEVDSFKPGQLIPSCQLNAKWTKPGNPSEFICKLTLKGAKEPCNYFCIDLDCAYTLPDPNRRDLNSEPKLQHLMNEVAAKIPSKWRDIGLQLGLSQGVLEGIATISPGNTNLCYSNVFTLWENQNTYPYTWSTILEVLQAPAVGEEKLATKIKSKLTGLPPQ